MPSARSQAVNFFTRIAYRKQRVVTEYRPRYARMDDRVRVPLPAQLTIDKQADPIQGRWTRNADAARRVILYLHGGAFILRLPNTHTAFAAQFCAELGASAFLPWYRLAPEHPFPAAPEDCFAAYRLLLDAGYRPNDIVLMGDSAGGNLALSSLHLIRRAGLPCPAAAVAFSPITDFAEISATWRLNRWRDPMYVVQARAPASATAFCPRRPSRGERSSLGSELSSASRHSASRHPTNPVWRCSIGLRSLAGCAERRTTYIWWTSDWERWFNSRFRRSEPLCGTGTGAARRSRAARGSGRSRVTPPG